MAEWSCLHAEIVVEFGELLEAARFAAAMRLEAATAPHRIRECGCGADFHRGDEHHKPHRCETCRKPRNQGGDFGPWVWRTVLELDRDRSGLTTKAVAHG